MTTLGGTNFGFNPSTFNTTSGLGAAALGGLGGLNTSVLNPGAASGGGGGGDWRDYLNLAGNVLGGLGGGSGSGGGMGIDFDELYDTAQEVAEYANEQSDLRVDETRDILNDLTYGITGQSPAEEYAALLNYPGQYYDEGILRAYGAAPRYGGMQATPTTADAFRVGAADTAQSIVDSRGVLDGFSPLYREEVMDLAKDPPTVNIDPSVYDDQVNKYLDAATLAQTYDYSGDQTQGFLDPAPSRFSRKNMMKDYGSEDTRKLLMDYSSY